MTMTICLLDRTGNCSVLTIQVVNINRHGGRNGAHARVRTSQARQLRENLLRSAPLGLSGKPLGPAGFAFRDARQIDRYARHARHA
jgi:hypothetical protein